MRMSAVELSVVSLERSSRTWAWIVTTGPDATHRIACHNPPTPNEVRGGRPRRTGFAAAPPPAGMLDELSLAGSTADLEGLVAGIEAEEGPLSVFPSAGGLPVPPEPERRNDGL